MVPNLANCVFNSRLLCMMSDDVTVSFSTCSAKGSFEHGSRIAKEDSWDC